MMVDVVRPYVDGDVAARQEIVERIGRVDSCKRHCRACGGEVALEKPFGRCDCGGSDLEWLSGEELRIKEYEVADV